ncbi:MAG: zincin-like metallopeptidase domain-containing protein [Hyphomicrobiaceae bacterium]
MPKVTPTDQSKPPRDSDRRDIYRTITDKIIAAIENNPGEPVMPWHRGGFRPVIPTNAATGNEYRGVNILSLWVTSLERGYDSGTFATYKQWASLGAQVRKGESASPIVFYREIEKTRDGGTGNPFTPGGAAEAETIRMARGYWVFAVEQVDGYAIAPELPANPIERIAAADAYVAATGAKVIVGGRQAYYRPSTDTIHMPDEARFFDTEGRTRSLAFFQTLHHELAHWTSAERRLNRQLGKRFGDDAYCAEEVIAETAACFIGARLGIAPEPHPDHARYILHWLTVMKSDARAMFAAAAKAQEIVTYLDGLQPDAALARAAA